MAEFKKERAAKKYIEDKLSISGAAQNAGLTIPEMINYLACKGYRSDYSMDDFRRGVNTLEKELSKQEPRKA